MIELAKEHYVLAFFLALASMGTVLAALLILDSMVCNVLNTITNQSKLRVIEQREKGDKPS